MLAALLLGQGVGDLLALRAADKARTDLATERAAATAAAAETSERYREPEGTYRENLDTIARESGQAQARATADADRAAAGRLSGDLADYITAIVRPPMLAPLPDSARQTPAPSICSPSCSGALTSERESWRKPAAGALPVSGRMKPAAR